MTLSFVDDVMVRKFRWSHQIISTCACYHLALDSSYLMYDVLLLLSIIVNSSYTRKTMQPACPCTHVWQVELSIQKLFPGDRISCPAGTGLQFLILIYFTINSYFNCGRISSVGKVLEFTVGGLGFKSWGRGYYILEVLKQLRNEGTAFALHTAKPSCSLDNHVEWWPCLQKEM